MTWWDFPQRAWIMILGELTVILFLGIWFSLTYLNDTYFQAYVNSLAPVLVPIVSVAFGIFSATIATLLFGMRKGRQTGSVEEAPRRRQRTRRTTKKPRVAGGLKTTLETGSLPGVPNPRFVITGPSPANETIPKPGTENKESE